MSVWKIKADLRKDCFSCSFAEMFLRREEEVNSGPSFAPTLPPLCQGFAGHSKTTRERS